MKYTTHAHIRRADSFVFQHSARDRSIEIEDSQYDVDDWLRSVGVPQDEFDSFEVTDERESATVTIVVTASDDGAAVLKKGNRVSESAKETIGCIVFTVDADATIPEGSSLPVACTAEAFGRPYNVPAATLRAFLSDVANVANVEQPTRATGGQDHALTKLATLHARERIYEDLMRSEGDSFDDRRKIAAKSRDAERKLLTKGGVPYGFMITNIGTVTHGRKLPAKTVLRS